MDPSAWLQAIWLHRAGRLTPNMISHEELWQRIVVAVPEGVWVVDREGRTRNSGTRAQLRWAGGASIRVAPHETRFATLER